MFSGSLLTLSYTNFIVLRIYAEALDRLRVRLNMYLVFGQHSVNYFMHVRFVNDILHVC